MESRRRRRDAAKSPTARGRSRRVRACARLCPAFACPGATARSGGRNLPPAAGALARNPLPRGPLWLEEHSGFDGSSGIANRARAAATKEPGGAVLIARERVDTSPPVADEVKTT